MRTRTRPPFVAPRSVALPVLTALLSLLASMVTVAVPAASSAATTRAVDALHLTLDPQTGEQALPSLAPGETVTVHAVIDRLSGPTLQAFQIGLEVDESLIPISVTLHPQQTIALKPTLTDVYVGLNPYLRADEGPHVLASWTFLRAAGFAADHTATITLRTLENGEAPEYRGAVGDHRADFRDAGAVTIGHAPAGVVRWWATPRAFVRERDYELEWATRGLEDLRLDDEPIADVGRRSHTALEPTTHVLSWNDDGRHVERALDVTPLREPAFTRLEVVRPDPDADLFNVFWDAPGADAVWWSPGDVLVAVSGVRGVTASEPTTITVRAENEWGATSRSVVVRSDGTPRVGSFTVEPTVIDRGDEALLRWSVLDAERVTLTPSGAEVALDGTLTVQPEETTTYRLVAEGQGTTAEAELTLEVRPVRITSFRAVPATIYPGEATTMSWSVVNADSVWIEPGVGAVDPVGGSMLVTPDSVRNRYVLRARSGEAETAAWLHTSWKPPEAMFWIPDSTPRELVAVSVWTEGATSASLFPYFESFEPTWGAWQELGIPGDQPADLRLVATNPAGSVEMQRQWSAHPPAVYLYVGRGWGKYLGQRLRIHASVYNAEHLVLEAPALQEEPLLDLVPEQGRFEGGLLMWVDDPVIFHGRAINVVGETEELLDLATEWIPAVAMSVEDSVLAPGESTVLSFDTGPRTNIRSLVLEPLGLELPRYGYGSVTISPSATTQYVVHMERFQGDRLYDYRGLITVEVVDGESSLLAEPMRPLVGTPYDLHVAMPADATEARLLPDVGPIAPQSQVIQRVAADPVEYLLEVTTPRGRQSARLLVDPDGVEVVSTLVQALELEGHAQGRTVSLSWQVETARPPRSMSLWRAVPGGELESWRPITAPSGQEIDAEVEPGASYVYQLRLEIDDQQFESDLVQVTPVGRRSLRLLPNVPNPFNPSTEIRWDLPEPGRAVLEIFDVRGRMVRRVDLGELDRGSGRWIWNGQDDAGRPAASGSYVARLSSGTSSAARKLVLVR